MVQVDWVRPVCSAISTSTNSRTSCWFYLEARGRYGAVSRMSGGCPLRGKAEPYNTAGRDEGQKPTQVGIGLHNGSVILGTVGESQRMDQTVISDAVNLASALKD